MSPQLISDFHRLSSGSRIPDFGTLRQGSGDVLPRRQDPGAPGASESRGGTAVFVTGSDVFTRWSVQAILEHQTIMWTPICGPSTNACFS